MKLSLVFRSRSCALARGLRASYGSLYVFIVYGVLKGPGRRPRLNGVMRPAGAPRETILTDLIEGLKGLDGLKD